MSELKIIDGPFARLLKAVGLVSVEPSGKIDHDAGADYVSNHGFRSQYDPKTSLSVLAAFPFPYACVTAISTDLSQVPIKVTRGRGKKAEQLDDHPILELLRQPSSRISGAQFRRQIYTDMVLVGNCYILVAGNNEPMSLLRLHPSRVTVSPLQDGQPDQYIYEGGSSPAHYDYEQVLHVRSPSWSDDPTSLWGVGSVQPLHHDLMTEKAQSELAARTAATGQPTGILSPSESGDLWNKRQIDTLRQAYESQMRKGGSGVLIMGGQANFQKLAFSPRELEFSAVRDYTRSATMAAFGVVPVRLGIESQNYATARSQMALYWEGLAGRAALIDSELTRLGRMYGDDDIVVEHDFSNVEVLQESRTDRVKRVLDWTMTGVPLNVAAAYEGFEDLPITSEQDLTTTNDEKPIDDEPDQTSTPEQPSKETSEPLAATALNGAQVASMLTILEQVAMGSLSPDAAVTLIQVAFPTVSEEQAQSIVDGASPVDDTQDTDDESKSLTGLSQAVREGLKNKAKEHNEQVDEKGMSDWKRTTARTLGVVFKRGVGAYNTNPGSVRPSVSSPEQWAYARVNSYLYALKNEKFRSGKHDTDLLPSEHPMSSKKSVDEKKNHERIELKKYESIDFSVPEGVKSELKKGLKWHEEGHSGDGLKPETVAWARRMSQGEKISPEKAVKMRAWLARHETDKSGEGFNPGEDGFPSPGRVAWALWGGDPAVSWSNKLVGQMEREDQKQLRQQTIDEGVWKNFVEKVQKPAEDEIRESIESYFDGYRKRISQRLPDVLSQYAKTISNGDIVTKNTDEPWLDELLDLESEGVFVDRNMRPAFSEAYKNAIRAAADSMPDELAENFSFPDQRIDDLVDQDLGRFITDIESQTRTSINVTIRNGLAEGMSVNQLQAALGTSFAFDSERALRIARTEATRAVNAGGVMSWEMAAEGADLDVSFRWLAQPGARDEHAGLHKKLRENDGFWYAGGVKAKAPGNFEGPPKLTAAMNINCRCTFVPEFEDED